MVVILTTYKSWNDPPRIQRLNSSSKTPFSTSSRFLAEKTSLKQTKRLWKEATKPQKMKPGLFPKNTIFRTGFQTKIWQSFPLLDGENPPWTQLGSKLQGNPGEEWLHRICGIIEYCRSERQWLVGGRKCCFYFYFCLDGFLLPAPLWFLKWTPSECPFLSVCDKIPLTNSYGELSFVREFLPFFVVIFTL